MSLGFSPKGGHCPNWAVIRWLEMRADFTVGDCKGGMGLGCLIQASLLNIVRLSGLYVDTYIKTSNELGKQDVQRKANNLLHLDNRTCLGRGIEEDCFNCEEKD